MPPDPQPWTISCRCRWCGGVFVKIEIDHAKAWVCETEACRERQLQWKITDIAGNLLYCPMPVQVDFEEAIASQQFGAICIGGHRSSSKSIALRMATYRVARRLKEFTALFLRREWSQIDANQMRFAEREAPRLGADFKNKRVKFPEMGSEIRFGHAQDPNDWEQYIGYDVDLINFEQVELFTQKQFAEISAATGRSTKYDTWRGLILATENPGGPLSDFVNQIFVRRDLDPQKYPDYRAADYHFIDAKLEDNPYTDARYEQRLAILSPARREMFRHGRRDVFEGQFFQSWTKSQHVIEGVSTQGASWFGSLHFGFNAPGHALLWAVLPSRHLYIRGCLRFEQMNEDALVLALDRFAAACGLRRMPMTFATPTLFTTPSEDHIVGQSIAETLLACGLPVVKADADLVNGWKRCHALLRPDPHGVPWLRVHPSCEDLINGLSNALSEDDDLDAINAASPMLSALHAFRYGAMSRPAPSASVSSMRPPAGSPAAIMARLRKRAS